MGQIDCMKITAKSAVIPLLVLIVIDMRSGAMAGQVTAGDNVQLLPEQTGVFAQAGSTGGSIGKQDKSVSGDQEDTGRTRRSERASSQRRERRESQSREMASARHDGSWRGTSRGTCVAIKSYDWTIQIRNGIVSGSDEAEGRVSSSGAANGTMVVFSTKYKWQGHFGSSQGSGTWIKPDGCTGSWTASRTEN